ncbi:MAG: hypothetical protein LUI10_12540 [Lachnospiraceae bacterium]|nr:hypothetical protein [Lachnospiraceae bacterium]
MTNQELWKNMEMLAVQEPSLERETSFMQLMKQAYDQNLHLIMASFYDSLHPGMARQGYVEVMEKRMLVCYTSKRRARRIKSNLNWDIAYARDIMNNMFHKDLIAGIVFNPDDENMVIIFKDLLLDIMPGEKPKPQGYRD